MVLCLKRFIGCGRGSRLIFLMLSRMIKLLFCLVGR